MVNRFLTRNNINLDISNRCTLACPKCTRNDFLLKGKNIPGHDMTIDEFKKIISFFERITFCGQVSDPVIHPQFDDFLKLAYDNGNKVEVRTAVSHRPINWYREKAFPANPNAIWVFGIDGLPKDSHKHRIRQNGNKLFDIMCLAKEYGLKVMWSCIIMSYNENDIDEIKHLAKNLNIDLQLVLSSRWNSDDSLKPVNVENILTGNFDLRSYISYGRI